VDAQEVKHCGDIALLTLLLFGLGCVPGAGRFNVDRLASHDSAPTVVALRSSTKLNMTESVLNGFCQRVNANVWSVSLEPDSDVEEYARRIEQLRPKMILAVGSLGLSFAMHYFHNLPTLVVLVMNYKHLGLETMPNMMGVAMETSPMSDFLQFKMVLPNMKRVLAFHQEKDSDAIVARARQELQRLGIELMTKKISDPTQIPTLYAKHRHEIDAVWLLPDSMVMNAKTFAELRSLTVHDHMPFIASLSEDFAQQGALMSASVDFMSLGAQAAGMAYALIAQGKAPKAIGFESPIGARLVLNTSTAEAIGVDVPDDIVPFLRIARN
jgi:putative ABC transport system substrate-binding protein